MPETEYESMKQDQERIKILSKIIENQQEKLQWLLKYVDWKKIEEDYKETNNVR